MSFLWDASVSEILLKYAIEFIIEKNHSTSKYRGDLVKTEKYIQC